MKSLILLIPILLLTSCVKDELESCPGAPITATLSAGDINYSNADDLGLDLVDENLPFRQYIPNYYYILKDINTGAIVATSPVVTVSGDEQEVDFTINDVPDGQYELIVWGNVSGEEPEQGALHADGTEGDDLYFAVDTITMAGGEPAAIALDLARVKGKLSVMFENLPAEITKVSMSVTNIYESRDANGYSGSTTVEKVFTRAELESDLFEMLLAPTVAGSTSMLSLLLYTDNSDTPAYVVDPVDVTIKDNEITAVSFDYNDLDGDFEVSVNIDGEWVVVKTLDLIPL